MANRWARSLTEWRKEREATQVQQDADTAATLAAFEEAADAVGADATAEE